MKILETERLLLREFNTDDAAFILVLLNNPTWLLYIGDRNIRSLEDAHDYLVHGPIKSYSTNGFGLWHVSAKEGNHAIGMCGLIRRNGLEHADIGFALLPQYAGKGYGYEIAAATMNHGKNALGLEHIIAITSEDNTHSIKLLNKIGLHFEKMIHLSAESDALMLFTENSTASKNDSPVEK